MLLTVGAEADVLADRAPGAEQRDEVLVEEGAGGGDVARLRGGRSLQTAVERQGGKADLRPLGVQEGQELGLGRRRRSRGIGGRQAHRLGRRRRGGRRRRRGGGRRGRGGTDAAAVLSDAVGLGDLVAAAEPGPGLTGDLSAGSVGGLPGRGLAGLGRGDGFPCPPPGRRRRRRRPPDRSPSESST